MAAESAQDFADLENQAQGIIAAFKAAGYELVAPAIIQPADVFLDVVGESLRARTYIFTDPDGDELCLRPDLTVPTCRLYLERHPRAEARARYCYNGPAFRFQPTGSTAAHPREARHAGLESIGASDREKAEADVVALTLEAIRGAGLENFKLRLGDLGIFHAVLEAVGMPERWRQRLTHSFWRRDEFRDELFRLAAPYDARTTGAPADLIAALDPDDRASSLATIEAYLANHGIELIGTRTLDEIADSLIDIAEDSRAEPLPQRSVEIIEQYVSVTAPSRAAGARLKDLMQQRGVDISDAIEVYKRRLELMSEAGVDVSRAEFCAEFGRNLEYYTGLVFEVVAPALGNLSPIAGGGRYDGLLKAVGAPHLVPAVGASIHTERLLEAVNLKEA